MEFETFPPEYIVKTTVTPPAECADDLFIDLIEMDVPLNDGAFSASSILSDAYGAKSAKFSSGIADDSAGSWSPAEMNKQQYLQVCTTLREKWLLNFESVILNLGNIPEN